MAARRPIRLLIRESALWAFGIDNRRAGVEPWLGRIDPEGPVLGLGVGGHAKGMEVADVALDEDAVWIVRTRTSPEGAVDSFLERIQLLPW